MLSVKKVFYALLVTKMIKYCIFFPKVSTYKIDFDETECTYFMIKEEKVFDKYMEFGENLATI